MPSAESITTKQQLFRDFVFGTLIYAVVLGFFEDYTNIIATWSYSVTFMVAVVMQLLTMATFALKKQVTQYFRGKQGKQFVAAMVFVVWLILFFSKFVFLATINAIFGQSVELSGFWGLMLIIVIMTLAQKLIEKVYGKLGAL